MKIKDKMYSVVSRGVRLYNRIAFEKQKDSKDLIVFNTASYTDNMGDFIIMRYCQDVLNELFGKKNYIDVSTHRLPSVKDEEWIKKTKYKFVCGTNLLTSHIEKWWNWCLPAGFRKKLVYRNVILLGVGWGEYQDECSKYSQLIYRSMLNPNVLHAVRDHYTEEKLKTAGIKNVINTGCPTMWNLTPDVCAEIPCRKADKVITTITDYRQDIESDNLMLQILAKNYKTIYIWLQGKKDEEYLQKLNVPENVIIIPRKLEEYEKVLRHGNIDYVGTRLHAGIFALNHCVRSIVIAVDNRAVEIAKDTNLPIVKRSDISKDLNKKICDQVPIDIRIPLNNIKIFKQQFYH